MSGDSEKAKGRFWLLQLVNYGAAALAFLAVAIAAGKFEPAVAAEAGYGVLILSAAAFFTLPNALRRHWARQDERR